MQPMTTTRRLAFEAAVCPHLPELRRAAMRLTRSNAAAEDVLQESLTRAWRYWDGFDSGSNARAWMHRIVHNTFVNGWRRTRREQRTLGDFQRTRGAQIELMRADHARQSVRDGVGDEVQQALAELPSEFREVVVLVDLQGLSYRDAAARIGRPVGTVMSRLHRGRRRLSSVLRAYAESEGYVRAA